MSRYILYSGTATSVIARSAATWQSVPFPPRRVGYTGRDSFNQGSPPSSRRRRSSETFRKNKIEESQHPLQDASFFYGLSHGLKIARQLSIFTPVCALVSPFRVPRCIKNSRHPKGVSGICGTPEGTRTPNPRNRNRMLYPLSHRCVLPSYYNNLCPVCKEGSGKFFSPFPPLLQKIVVLPANICYTPTILFDRRNLLWLPYSISDPL